MASLRGFNPVIYPGLVRTPRRQDAGAGRTGFNPVIYPGLVRTSGFIVIHGENRGLVLTPLFIRVWFGPVVKLHFLENIVEF